MHWRYTRDIIDSPHEAGAVNYIKHSTSLQQRIVGEPWTSIMDTQGPFY